MPDAEIILVDNGNIKIEKIDGVDKQIYLGNRLLFRLTSDSPNKSLGETMMLLYACKYLNDSYEYIFKISGRYWLNDYFSIENFKNDAFTFLHLMNNSQEILGKHSFVTGIHSTRLYAFPGKYLKEYKRSLRKSLKDIRHGKSIEAAWPQYIQKQLYYTNRLGVSGYIGVDKDWKDE